MWQIRLTKLAERRYYRLNKPLQAKFDVAVKELENSVDPKMLETFKHSKKYRAFFYNLSSSVRLVYHIFPELKLIVILDVGDHKTVYGHD